MFNFRISRQFDENNFLKNIPDQLMMVMMALRSIYVIKLSSFLIKTR